jgi:putative membrane protein
MNTGTNMSTDADPIRIDSTSRPQGPVTGPVSGPVDFVEDEPTAADPPLTVDADDSAPTAAATTASNRSQPLTGRQRLDRLLVVATVISLLTLAVIFVISRVAIEASTLVESWPTIGRIYVAACVAVALLVGILGIRSARRYWRIRAVTRLRRSVEAYQQRLPSGSVGPEQLREELTAYLSTLETHTSDQTRIGIATVGRKFNDYSGDGTRDIEEIETHVLDALDREADAVIASRSAQVAVATALAPHSFDAMIVLWQSVKLIDQVSRIYAGRPGLWGTLRLFRRAMAAIVFAEIAQLATEAVVDAVAKKTLATIAGRVTEGVTNGLLMMRLGETVKQQCRPIPCDSGGTHPIRRLVQALNSRGVTPAATSSQMA